MNTSKRYMFASFMLLLFFSWGCKKPDYSFGTIKTPTGLALAAVVEGVDASNPNGNGSGNVAINVTATDALSYKVDYGDGRTQVLPSGAINYKYTNPGLNEYTITVNAIGTGGAISTISKKVKVFVAFQIPAEIVAALTNGSSKIWVTNKEAVGHFGVGPNDQFAAIWYEAGPGTREPCAYDDEITFSKDANNNVFMEIANKGESFSIGASTSFYGFAGGDGCYAINTGGKKKLIFMNATSGSTPAVSSGIQFTVPGNGIINFGTGGTTYEILSYTNGTIHLRNIGADGNAWYQKLKVKP